MNSLGPVRIVDRDAGTVEIEMPIPAVGLSPALSKLLRIAARNDAAVALAARRNALGGKNLPDGFVSVEDETSFERIASHLVQRLRRRMPRSLATTSVGCTHRRKSSHSGSRERCSETSATPTEE